MENTQPNKFTLDGTEYNLEDVSDAAKYLVFNLNEIQANKQKVERKISQYIAAEKTFVQELREELNAEEFEEVVEGEEA